MTTSLPLKIIAVSILIVLSSCVSIPQVETPIHQEKQGTITLRSSTDPSYQAKHPHTIETNHLLSILQSLYVQEEKALLSSLISGEGERVPVFSTQESLFLAPHLSTALSQTTPEEYVWFQISPKSEGKETVTNGVLYVLKDSLRIGLQEFKSDPRNAKLSSKPSYPPTQIKKWNLGTDLNSAILITTFPVPAKIGTVTINLRQPAVPPIKPNDIITPKEIEREYEDGENLNKEIKGLHQRLEEQNKKLQRLEQKLEQKNLH